MNESGFVFHGERVSFSGFGVKKGAFRGFESEKEKKKEKNENFVREREREIGDGTYKSIAE